MTLITLTCTSESILVSMMIKTLNLNFVDIDGVRVPLHNVQNIKNYNSQINRESRSDMTNHSVLVRPNCMWDTCLNANELQTLHVSHIISGLMLHQPGRPMVVFFFLN